MTSSFTPRLRIAALPLALTVLALGLPALSSGTAHAGIIVTVGKPNPEPCRDKQSPFTRGSGHERRTFQSEGTRCVELPGGDVECGKSIRVESVSSLPRDWRCVSVAPGLLWCETPTPPVAPMGSGPAAAAGGEFDPTRYDGSSASSPSLNPMVDSPDSGDDLLAVGCSSGGLSNLLPLFGALPLIALCRRRRGC